MARPKDCIYCGSGTGSREHTFPAALGGRRWNKGILCGSCNNRFSELDGELTDQLRLINGMIGVRPDHSDRPPPAVFERGAFGLHVDGTGMPSLARPRIVAVEQHSDKSGVLSMEFGSEQKAQEWIAARRAEGVQLKQLSRRVGRKFFNSDLRAPWSFGGETALREVGRVALNFLAHYWPKIARLPFLRAIKEYVLEGIVTSSEPVVWYAAGDEWEMPEGASRFSHQVLVRLGGASSDCFARVRFFQAIDIIVYFGRMDGGEAAVRLVDINPLADGPPMDIRDQLLDPVSIPGHVIRPVTALEQRGIEAFKNGIARLLASVRDHWWQLNSRSLLDVLGSLRELPVDRTIPMIAAALEAHDGRILILARVVVKELEQRFGTQLSTLGVSLGEFVETDEQTQDGLTARSRDTLGRCRLRIAATIAVELEGRGIAEERLRLLLEGGPGMALIGKTLIEECVPGAFGGS